MATLTGNQINSSYEGLIKTADNAQITATAKSITDGAGNATNIQIGTTSTNFVSGTVNFTGSTVSGLPASPVGLISGSALYSMQSAPALTLTAANANGADSIALGSNARVNAKTEAIAIGIASQTTGNRSVSIGRASNAGENSIAIGNFSGGAALRSISMAASGVNVQDNRPSDSVMIVPGTYGGVNDVTAVDSIVIGSGTSGTFRAGPGAIAGIAIGKGTLVSAAGAVALGSGITAATVDTVTIKKLQMLNYATLDYADDTSAAAGGIPLGGVYHTSGALKIRIV